MRGSLRLGGKKLMDRGLHLVEGVLASRRNMGGLVATDPSCARRGRRPDARVVVIVVIIWLGGACA